MIVILDSSAFIILYQFGHCLSDSLVTLLTPVLTWCVCATVRDVPFAHFTSFCQQQRILMVQYSVVLLRRHVHKDLLICRRRRERLRSDPGLALSSVLLFVLILAFGIFLICLLSSILSTMLLSHNRLFWSIFLPVLNLHLALVPSCILLLQVCQTAAIHILLVPRATFDVASWLLGNFEASR